MVQTEKPTTIAAKKQQGIVETKKTEKQLSQPKTEQPATDKQIPTKTDEQAEKKDEKKTKKQPVKKIKKDKVFINARNVHVSTKNAMAICKFIKGKKIETAINDLQKVLEKKQAVPMKGEIPHKKGKGMMSGRYPQETTKAFILLLKSLQGNANNHDVEEPVIVEAIANIGERPYGRFGRWKRKRTHVKIVSRTKKEKKK